MEEEVGWWLVGGGREGKQKGEELS